MRGRRRGRRQRRQRQQRRAARAPPPRRAPPPGAAAACHAPRARSPRASPRDSDRHVEALLAEAEAAVAASGGGGGRAGGAWAPEHRGDDDVCRWRPARAVHTVGR